MISIREIADHKTTISTTRWAFALTVKVDVIVICITVLVGLVSHFVPGIKELNSTFYGNVALLLGVLTTVTGTAKALQGFEPYRKSDDEVSKETPIEDKEISTK